MCDSAYGTVLAECSASIWCNGRDWWIWNGYMRLTWTVGLAARVRLRSSHQEPLWGDAITRRSGGWIADVSKWNWLARRLHNLVWPDHDQGLRYIMYTTATRYYHFGQGQNFALYTDKRYRHILMFGIALVNIDSVVFSSKRTIRFLMQFGGFGPSTSKYSVALLRKSYSSTFCPRIAKKYQSKQPFTIRRSKTRTACKVSRRFSGKNGKWIDCQRTWQFNLFEIGVTHPLSTIQVYPYLYEDPRTIYPLSCHKYGQVIFDTGPLETLLPSRLIGTARNKTSTERDCLIRQLVIQAPGDSQELVSSFANSTPLKNTMPTSDHKYLRCAFILAIDTWSHK